MTLPKKAIIISLAIIIVVGAVSVFVLKFAPQLAPKIGNIPSPSSSATSVSFRLVPTNTTLGVGDKVKVAVYLNGPDVEKASVLDVKLNFDKTKLKLLSATPGKFFDPYIKIKWDESRSWFALSRDPESSALADPNSPVMTLEFTATSKSGSVTLSTDPASTIYLSKIGGAIPAVQTVSFSVE